MCAHPAFLRKFPMDLLLVILVHHNAQVRVTPRLSVRGVSLGISTTASHILAVHVTAVVRLVLVQAHLSACRASVGRAIGSVEEVAVFVPVNARHALELTRVGRACQDSDRPLLVLV